MFDMFGRIAPESLRRSGCKGVKHAFSGIISELTLCSTHMLNKQFEAVVMTRLHFGTNQLCAV